MRQAAGESDCPLALGCTVICATRASEAASDGTSPGGRQATGEAEYGVARPANRVGNAHRCMVRRNRPKAGSHDRHGALVFHRHRSASYSLGPHANPEGKREPKAYFSTNQAQGAAEIVEDFVKRWPIEVTYEESRAHLGVETQRQWSDLAIERSTPSLLGLYSVVVLLGLALHPDGIIPVQQAAWYPKTHATFSDVLATVRRHLWDGLTFQTSAVHPDLCLVPRSDLTRLLQAACY